MRRPVVLVLTLVVAAQVAVAATLSAQKEDAESQAWRLEGLRKGFCVQLLMDPAAKALEELPAGYRAVPASEATDLHVSLRAVVEGQPEYASWSPSRLCFNSVDTVRTDEFILGDKSGRHPQLFASWTVLAAGPGGPPGEVALNLFSNSERLIRSARLTGLRVREARLSVGPVPIEDENGVPSSDERFQVKVGKTTVTWDGRLARDSSAAREPFRLAWVASSERGGVATGELVLSAVTERPMAGSLKVEGKDAFAKALRASPTRFAGPAYQGGEGSVSLHR